MGKILEKLKEMRARNDAPASANPGRSGKTAQDLLSEHRAKQGYGVPSLSDAPTGAVSGAPAAPPGGMVETEEERLRRMGGGGIKL